MHGPVYVKDLGGIVEVSVYGAGRNWRFAGTSAQQMDEHNPGVSVDVISVLAERGVTEALVPKPCFNGLVALREQLGTEVLPGFHRGADADGVLLTSSGQAYILGSADCLAVVIIRPDNGTAVGLHCGRDALVDRARLRGEEPRDHESVIDAGMAALLGDSSELAPTLKVFMAAGIGPDSFEHPTHDHKWAEVNTNLVAYLRERHGRSAVPDEERGTIDLAAIASTQLRRFGVLPSNIDYDGHDTAVDRKGDSFLFHSNRRDPTQRNLVVVKLL